MISVPDYSGGAYFSLLKVAIRSGSLRGNAGTEGLDGEVRKPPEAEELFGYPEDMKLDFTFCYEAVRSRDARFDGRFFTAVVTTGIYCRSICPARTPKPENVRFFPCAAAAEEAGFRPCKRCQPNHAPGTSLWLGPADSVSRALALVESGFLDDHSLEDLADRLHVSSRHLRRLFAHHLGTNPVAVAQTRRLHFAWNLLQETSLSIINTALAAGFSSLRRFNECFHAVFGCPPSQLRGRKGKRPSRTWDLQLNLWYRPPFDWMGMLGFLSARAIPGVESVAGGEYRRMIGSPEMPGHICVSQAPAGHSLVLKVAGVDPRQLSMIVTRIRRLFDLGAAPDVVIGHLAKDPLLSGRLPRHPGLRVPGAWNGFELAVRAILGQQVSILAATTLAGRLVANFGTPLGEPPSPCLTHLFPVPRQLAESNVEAIGLTRARGDALRGLARAVADGRLDLEGNVDPEAVRSILRELPGIGDWTTEYIAMRALADPDAFPASDLGIRRALEDSGQRITPRIASRLAENWRPWRAYGAMLLWLEPDSGIRKGVSS